MRHLNYKVTFVARINTIQHVFTIIVSFQSHYYTTTNKNEYHINNNTSRHACWIIVFGRNHLFNAQILTPFSKSQYFVFLLNTTRLHLQSSISTFSSNTLNIYIYNILMIIYTNEINNPLIRYNFKILSRRRNMSFIRIQRFRP